MRGHKNGRTEDHNDMQISQDDTASVEAIVERSADKAVVWPGVDCNKPGNWRMYAVGVGD